MQLWNIKFLKCGTKWLKKKKKKENATPARDAIYLTLKAFLCC